MARYKPIDESNISLHADRALVDRIIVADRLSARFEQLNEEVDRVLRDNDAEGDAVPYLSDNDQVFYSLEQQQYGVPPASPRHRSESVQGSAYRPMTTPQNARKPIPRDTQNPNHLSTPIRTPIIAVPLTLPDHYFGSTDLDKWLVHFNMIAELNNWEGQTKASYLCASLRGDALDAISNLTSRDRSSLDLIVQTLRNELVAKESAQSYRLQLRRRKRKECEKLLALSKDIRYLTNKAYPGAPQHIIDSIAIDHFIEALPNASLRMQIRREKPRTLIEAVTSAQFEEDLLMVDEDRNPLGRRLAAVQPDSNFIEMPTKLNIENRPSNYDNVNNYSFDRPNTRPTYSDRRNYRPNDSPPTIDNEKQWKNKMEAKMNELFEITKDLRDKCKFPQGCDPKLMVGMNSNRSDVPSSQYWPTNNRPNAPNRKLSPGFRGTRHFRRPRSDIQCYNCFEFGHYQNECFQKNRGIPKPSNGHNSSGPRPIYENENVRRPPIQDGSQFQNRPQMQGKLEVSHGPPMMASVPTQAQMFTPMTAYTPVSRPMGPTLPSMAEPYIYRPPQSSDSLQSQDDSVQYLNH